jgi:hypothetical protein
VVANVSKRERERFCGQSTHTHTHTHTHTNATNLHVRVEAEQYSKCLVGLLGSVANTDLAVALALEGRQDVIR